MNLRWLSRFFVGFGLTLILCGCLIGNKLPAVTPSTPLAPPLPGKPSAPAASQPAGPAGANAPQALPAGTPSNPIYLPLVQAPAPVPSGPPLATDSLYITSLDATTLYNQGCALGTRDLNLPGKQDSVVILHFGYPRMVNGQFGARLYYPAAAATVDQIAAATQNFGYGYWYCVGADFESHLQVGIGTSNYDGSIYSLVTAGHGAAWARMVNQVNDWFINTCPRGCDGQVSAVGANDLELSWADYASSLDWLNGYDSANNSMLYNFGALPGCPYLASPNANCGGGGYTWTREQVWMVTYGVSPVFPMPEIYRTDGVNAQQWYLMSLYSFNYHGVKMSFIGPMSQYQACLQRGGCYSIDNTPQQAWNQLSDLLNGDNRTAGEMLPYLTDILWLNEPIPSSGAAAAAALQAQAAKPPHNPNPGQIAMDLQSALQSGRVRPADRPNFEEKLKLAQQLAPKAAITLAKPSGQKPALQSAAQPQTGAAIAPQEEILEGSEGLVHTWEATILNLWEGQRSGVYYQVLAGASVDDPTQGLVWVIETQPGGQRAQNIYLTPDKTGALRIQSVQGTRVTLSAPDRSTLYFDLQTRTFARP